MRWGIRKHHKNLQSQYTREQQEQKEGNPKNRVFSFSPLSWLSKLTAKPNANATAKPKPIPTAKNTAAFPSCFTVSAGASLPADFFPTAAADIAPRRLSVGNDNADVAAARQQCRRRHYSVGGDRDLPPLGHLIPFSRAASLTPEPMTPVASGTDAEARPRSRRRRRRGGRRSFSGRMPVRVRVGSPRRVAAVSELEKFAVVRRTRDPQKEFRESMVEMIASKRIGRPDELETLLACYLSLNADEHHDCIIKVFRQVWFEINPCRIAVPAQG